MSRDGSITQSRFMDVCAPSMSTTSPRRKPSSCRRYASKSAVGVGFRCRTFMAPSPRPSEKLARPPAMPWTVAMASAARSGWRSGTATAVPTFSVVVSEAAMASATYGSGSRPWASPTARPSHPPASISCARGPICVTGTGVAPMRQNSTGIASSLAHELKLVREPYRSSGGNDTAHPGGSCARRTSTLRSPGEKGGSAT